MKIPVTGIQRFCMHDGPGLRTVVFLKGCPLRCKWCHNPETQNSFRQIFYDEKKCIGCGACAVCPNQAHVFRPDHAFDRVKCTACGSCTELCPTGALERAARMMEPDEILELVERDRDFFGQEGGLTLSGGEPMAHPEESLLLLKKAKEAGISTAVETCGYFDSRYIPDLCQHADTLLWDFKDSDAERHRYYTGVSNQKILENLKEADRQGGNIVLRCILLQGINYTPKHIGQIEALYRSLVNCHRVDFLPYHPMGSDKYRLLGIEDTFHDKRYIPEVVPKGIP